MPTKGGRCVIDLNIGTKIRPPTPRKNIVLRCLAVSASASVMLVFSAMFASSPFRECERMYAGMTIDTSDGMNISMITPAAVISPLFHSIMVVTSPIGENAPPEFAAIITSEAYIMRSFFSFTSLRNIIIITIDVVRLSRMADRMNVMNAMRQSSFFLLLVFIVSLTKLNPPFWSTSSTIVIAPMRKNSVVDVLPRCFSIMAVTCWSSASCEKSPAI